MWGLVIEMARSSAARHKLIFVHGMLPTEVAADQALHEHVLPYQVWAFAATGFPVYTNCDVVIQGGCDFGYRFTV